MADEKKLLKPIYLKGGRDLKGVETQVQLYGARDYLRSIGIEPLYFYVENDIIAEVTEPYAIKVIKNYEKLKEKASE